MYSNDLIQRVIFYYKNNNTTLNKTAKIFNVSISSIKRWLNNQIPLGTRNKKITNYYNDVQNIIDNKPYITIKEIQNEIDNKLSIGSIFNIIKQINYSNKKIKYKHFYNNKQNKDDKINDFIKNNKDINDYISIDETYFNCYINPLNGYSKKGTKIFINNKIIVQKFSVLMAISKSNIINYQIYNTSINTNLFSEFIQKLPNNSNLLLDNVSFHKSKKIKEIALNKNLNLKFIPPYSPEFNPIENVFSMIKSIFRKNKFKYESIKNNIIDSIKFYKNYDFSSIYNNIQTQFINKKN